jgi:hypothetical protein
MDAAVTLNSKLYAEQTHAQGHHESGLRQQTIHLFPSFCRTAR